MHSYRRAFTLIELLVVILIIGLLSAVATTSFLNAQRNSRDSARKSNVNAIAGAVEAYRTAKGKYPGAIKQDASTKPAEVLGCVQLFGTAPNQLFVYFFQPKSDCSKSTVLDTPHTKDDFAPAPNWIPGLGPYLNPPATEKSYLGSDVTQPEGSPNFETTGAYIGAPKGNTRTFSYNKSSNGYSIYAKLENGDCNSSVTPNPCLYFIQK